MSTHKELRELVGVYAVNALDPDERRHVESHLAGCRACAEELVAHLETLAALTENDEPVPSEVWDRISGSLEERPPQALFTKAARPWMPKRLGFVLAAAATIVFVAMGSRLVQQERRLDSLTVALSSRSISEVAQSAASDPRALLLSLQSPDKTKFARVVVLPDGTAYLTANNLDALPDDKTYQLWALRGDERISLGVLGRDPGVSAFRSVGEAAGFAITVEHAGGVPLTTNNPVVFGFTQA